ncbi:MAG: S8 family serine peptidase [Alphaproteobacteria bacterium]|nr:S8 family serine peptidase [Alphaproteobacteria bacterium]
MSHLISFLAYISFCLLLTACAGGSPNNLEVGDNRGSPNIIDNPLDDNADDAIIDGGDGDDNADNSDNPIDDDAVVDGGTDDNADNADDNANDENSDNADNALIDDDAVVDGGTDDNADNADDNANDENSDNADNALIDDDAVVDGGTDDNADNADDNANDENSDNADNALIDDDAVVDGGGTDDNADNADDDNIVILNPIDFETDEYTKNYALANIKASAIYARGGTGKGQTVSILDTPFNTTHADLQNVFVTGFDASSGGTNVHCDTNDCATHGTHIAGIIAGNKDDAGMHGVAYEAKIKPIAIFSDAGVGDITTAQLANAIYEGSGDDIIAMNNSWGSHTTSRITVEGIGHYYYERPHGQNFVNTDGDIVNHQMMQISVNAWKQAVNDGTIVVFANGNHGLNSETGKVKAYYNSDLSGSSVTLSASFLLGADNANIPSFEGNYANIESELAGKWLTVIAVDSDNRIASFSNGCGDAKEFCLAAPGHTIYSTSISDGDEQYENKHGTSMAAPHVTGALAALKSLFPSMTSTELVDLVLNTADDLGDDGTDDVYGRGMLNLDEASKPQGDALAVNIDNQALAGGVRLSESNINLSHHFGGVINDLSIGIRDNYNRSFTATPAQAMIDPLTFGLDAYISNLESDDNITTKNFNEQNFNSQAHVTFSTQSDNAWMNASYHYGASSAQIVFYADYRIDDLNLLNKNTTNNLRFTDIRPAGTDIAHIKTTHQLDDTITFTPYAAKGAFAKTAFDSDNNVNDRDFSELGADISYDNGKTNISIGIGNLREYQQFLGAQTSGAYALKNASLSRFTDLHIQRNLTPDSENESPDNKIRLTIYADYTQYQTDVDMLHHDFASIENLTANQYQIGFIGKNIAQTDDRLTINLATKLGVTSGTLTQNTVDGYDENGNFNNVTHHYQLATQQRNHQLAIAYQSRLPYLNKNKVQSNLIRNGKFFTSVTIDRNLYNQNQLNQTKMMVGISTKF